MVVLVYSTTGSMTLPFSSIDLEMVKVARIVAQAMNRVESARFRPEIRE
jgi:hypothetical protein